MTVDSEAIFALMELTRSDHAALEQLRGSMATAWIDERVAGRLHLARGVARPLWIGRARREVFFASTKSALEVVEGALRLTLRKHEVSEGRLLHLERGRIATEARFRTDRSLPRRPGCCRPCARRTRAPRASRSSPLLQPPSDGARALAASRASRRARTVTPSSRSRSRTRYWNAAHGPASMSTSR